MDSCGVTPQRLDAPQVPAFLHSLLIGCFLQVTLCSNRKFLLITLYSNRIFPTDSSVSMLLLID